MISGNHSMPRVRGTASVFRLFDIPEFGQIFPVYKRAYEKIRLGELAIHAVPQCLANEDLHEELKKAGPDPSARFNVLMLHAAVAGVPEFSMGEFSEQVVPEDFLRPDYDYIALGHYHRFTNVRKNAYYAGATERFGFGEVDQDKGIVEVDLAAKTVKFHKLALRPMRDLSAIDAAGMEPEQIQAAIEAAVRDTEGSVARLTVQNISPLAQSALDFNKLKELAKQATHLEIRYVKDESETEQEIAPAAIGSLSDELRGFIGSRPADKKNEVILNLGLEYLDRAARERS
jgi:DNA repair exonuclease SbcCD nuclease subunit